MASREAPHKGGRAALYGAVFMALCAVYSLLPVERGLGTVSLVAGVPLTVTMIVSAVSFLVLVAESNGRILVPRCRRYTVPQGLFVASLAIAAALSRDPKGGMFVTLNYGITFIVNFRNALITIICATAAAAAAIGFLESAFGYYLPFYEGCFRRFAFHEMTFAMAQRGAFFRVLGPLGNPILHGVLLSLALPFALSVKGLMRVVWVSILLAGIVTCTSMTGILMAFIVLVGLGLRYARRGPFALFLVACLVGVVALVGEQLIGALGNAGQRTFNGNEEARATRLQMLELGVQDVAWNGTAPERLAGRGLRCTWARGRGWSGR